MKTLWGRALVVGFTCLPGLAYGAPARPLDCLAHFHVHQTPRQVGVETIQSFGNDEITIFLPLPKTDEGRVLDINAIDYHEAFPEKFLLTDGTLRSAFVSVDLRAGSRLNRCADELTRRLVEKVGRAPDDVLNELVHFLDDYMDPVPDGFRYPWDLKELPPLPPDFAEAAHLRPGHYPLATELRHPSVPLESFLHEHHGVCQQRVMFASLVLSRLGIPHRLRAGGSGNGQGHIWIELPDGRHLDPTWHLLEVPTYDDVPAGWFRIGRTTLFRNQVYPFVVD